MTRPHHISPKRRRTVKFIGALLLALSMVGTSFIQASASRDVRRIVDQQWRGAYDILVTAESGATTVGSSRVLAPYSLATAAQRLTLRDVQTVRAMNGVEVAAPIGDALIRTRFDGPRVLYKVPLAKDLYSPHPLALRVSLNLSVRAVDGWHDVRAGVFDVILDMSNGPSEVVVTGNGVVEDGTCDHADGAQLAAARPSCQQLMRVPLTYQLEGASSTVVHETGIVSQDALLVELPTLVETAPHVLFVDPDAEAQLLGKRVNFLRPLRNVTSSFSVADLRAANVAGKFESDAKSIAAWLASVQPAEATWAAQHKDAVVPLVSSPGDAVDARLLVQVERGFGAVSVSQDPSDSGFVEWAFPRALSSGSPGKTTDAETYEVGRLLETADPQTAVFPLPGMGAEDVSAPAPVVANRATAWAFVSQSPLAERGGKQSIKITKYIHPVPVDPGGVDGPWLTFSDDGLATGVEAATQAVASRGATPPSEPLMVSVGSAATSEIESSGTDKVPLGSIGGTSTRLIRHGDGTAANELIPPSYSGLGLSSIGPSAFANIDSAESLGITEPVSSIRVRVAGVGTGYTVANLARVQNVLEEIRGSGYRATMVAGSSETPIAFDVSGYPLLTNSSGSAARPSSLGTVEQNWPELGAAARVDRAVSGGNYSVAILTTLSAGVLFALLLYAESSARAATRNTLLSIGWSLRRVRRSFLREDLPVVITLLIGALVAALSELLLPVARENAESSRTAILFIVVGGIGCIGAVWAAVAPTMRVGLDRGSTATVRRLRRASRNFGGSAAAVGRLLMNRDKFAIALTTAAVLIGSLTSGALVAVAVSTMKSAGASKIAGEVLGANLVAQCLLAALGVCAAVLLTSACLEMEAEKLGTRSRVLITCGWDASQQRRLRIAELACVAVPAVVVACIVAWMGATVSAQPPIPTTLGAALGGSAVALAFGLKRVAKK